MYSFNNIIRGDDFTHRKEKLENWKDNRGIK